MAVFTPQVIGQAGLAPGYAAVSASDTITGNDGNCWLHVKNGNVGTAITVTVVSLNPCSHGGTHNLVVAIPISSERMIGPFPRDRFGETVTVNHTTLTSVTAGVFRLGAGL
jgi:hypothetical protein